jgi:plastocyanin
VIVSRGPGQVKVPDVAGLAALQASERVVRSQLQAGGQVEAPSATVPKGSIVGTMPAAGSDLAPGTTVRFVNVSGGPHNITFWQDSVPAGAAAALNANMKNTVDNLSGAFLTQPNESYDVSFANAPKGTYKGYCTPHLTLGMKIAIKVE